ncbi:MAG: protoporphyrinogen oxidase [Aquificaceae bacterium]|nr:protoporphyrinogen oxidase [Aquificaceae bacterium]MCX8060286.1 protoporphyrinogen oxidase [Aquificaceae bacterium]MDW8097311.1 protoporphyrinogen oxidase [Aquificaceae bacterium]
MIEVAVVGAGISGLSVAWHLSQKGYRVLVFEKEEVPGGNIQTLRKDRYLLELGPQTILADKKVEEFFSQVGIKPEHAKESSKIRYVYKKGRLIPLPLSPLSFFTSPLLSLGSKLRVLKEPFVPPSPKSEESVAEFVRRRLGREFLDYIVAPFISGVYAGDPEELSVKHAVRRVYELEQKFGSLIKGAIKLRALGPGGRLVSFPGGNHALIEHLSSKLEVDTENVVLRIRRKEDRYVLEAKKGKYEAKSVVVTAPATSAGYLLRDISWSASQEFDKVYYAPVVVVHVVVESGAVPPGFGFLVPRVEGKRMLGVLFSSQLFEGRAPEGKELLTVYLGGATDPELVEQEEETIKATVEKELREILSVGKVEILHTTRWKKAIPQYTLGYGKYLELAQTLEGENPGLFLAGNYLFGVSVSDCIRASYQVAKKVEEYLSGAPD